MNPITREEYFLAKIAGEESPEIQPVTREEIFLAKAAGMDVPELEPVTRKEWFISQISGGGGGGGGGGSSYHLIASQEFEWNYSSSTEAVIDTMQLPASAWTKDKMMFVKIRLVGSASYSTFLGSDSLLANSYAYQSYTYNNSFMKTSYYSDSSHIIQNNKTAGTKCPGITGAKLSSTGLLSFNAYTSPMFKIDGHFKVEVYELDWPDDISPYNEYSA